MPDAGDETEGHAGVEERAPERLHERHLLVHHAPCRLVCQPAEPQVRHEPEDPEGCLESSQTLVVAQESIQPEEE